MVKDLLKVQNMIHGIRRQSSVTRHNYLQLLFVFAAFALMAFASYFFIGRILQSRLLSGANELLFSAEANVRTGLSEAETTLNNSYYIVQNLVERNASKEEIFDYLNITSEWMRKREQGLMSYYGIYGYINGEFYDSMGFNASGNYIPQRQPWYQTAIRSGRRIAYTPPYEDARTDDAIISVVRNIDIKNGEIAGILSVDISIHWLMEYISSLKLSPDGYGMLLNLGVAFITHPDSTLAGSQLQDLGDDYKKIAQTLLNGREVFAQRVMDPNGFLSIVFFRQIFNGWYVGIVTPYSQFYRDLYESAWILVALGLVLSLSLCFFLLRMSVAKIRADEENKLKSSFLASMSHEIRTPMNAITGMAELLLRGDLSDEARGYAQDIKHAGNNLVSIINDILDFSKIEAGKLEIIPVKYLLSSLISDTVNIICMRIGGKPLRFFTNIDGNIPNTLSGDEVRLRQILLNLLSNAVKYSEKGHIGLTITVDKRDDKQVWLKIAVTDTGKGIKPEDQTKLFDEFVQVDAKKNRGIEGTGLGLAITRRLCIVMGGDITVESEYGKGSNFTVIIPQTIESETPFAAVEEPEKKKVLVYERRAVYAKAVCWSLENLRVPFTMVTNLDDFAATLPREEWFYIFSGYGLYKKIKPVMENAVFLNGKKPPLSLMIEWGAEVFIPDVRFMSLPVQSLSIANILNDKADSKSYFDNAGTGGAVRSAFPEARILVVDDIATNLKVAEGLLAPYLATVDTCSNGLQAIEIVKLAFLQKREYDIIFMDHMMPEMDGIEATAAIRALEGGRFNAVPIIALTANAVVGMREVFIEKGFNDFLTKPIDVTKLDETLERWMPKEKRAMNNTSFLTSHSSLPVIPGVDTAKGIAMTGGTLEAYRDVLIIFREDIQERLSLLQTVPAADVLPAFITQIHALKSASASIGAAELSARAAALEAAGKAADFAFIKENLSAFAECFSQLAEGILVWEKAVKKFDSEKQTTAGALDLVMVMPLLRKLAEALKSQKGDDIDRILEQIAQQPLGASAKTAMDKITDEVLVAEYEKAGEILESIINGRINN
jgi:signal transduction histidine kinase/CheY-like chemotaxis protein